MTDTLDQERGAAAPDKLPLPPLVSAPPVMGSLRGLTGNVRAFLTDCYLSHGPAFRLRIPQGELYVLAGPEANVFVTKSGADLFRSKESWQAVDREMGAERSLISSDGAYHRKMRALQKPLYARDKVSQNYDALVRMTVGDLRAWADRAESFAAVYACQQLVTEQLGMMATGASVRPYLDDLMLWIGTVLRVHQNRARPGWWLRLPHVARARRRVMELYRATLASRAGEPHDPTNAVDLAVATNQSDPELLTEEEMVALILGPFIAGLDTEAAATGIVLYSLLTNPKVLARVTEEADAFFSGEGPTAEKLAAMPTLHHTFMEALRLNPIAPALSRTATRDFAFAGYQIPAESTVIFGTTVSHYLPRFYPDPERFDPDRFNRERAEHRQPGAYAPFGIGPHVCLGAGLAEDQMALNIATILHYVELEMVPGDYRLKLSHLPTPRPNKNFKIRVRRWRHTPPDQRRGSP